MLMGMGIRNEEKEVDEEANENTFTQTHVQMQCNRMEWKK